MNATPAETPTAKPPLVEVLNIRKMEESGNLKAFADISIAGKVTIYGCKIVQKSGQAAWLAMPSREYSAADGTKKFAPVVEIEDKNLKEAVTLAVLKAWEAGGAA